MIFEIWKDGKRMMFTQSKDCIPDDQTIALMQKAGYKTTLDGKPYKPIRKKKQKQ